MEETFRREFQTRVEEALDGESARFLMAHLPPVPWPEVATKHDLEAFQVATKHDLEAFQVATKHDFEAVRVDIEAVRLANNNGLKLLEARMEGGFNGVRAELALLITRQTRTMIISLVTVVMALSAVALFR